MYSRSTGEMRASCSASATVALSDSSSISLVEAAPRFLSIQTVTPTVTFSRATGGEGIRSETQVTVAFTVHADDGIVSFYVAQQLFTDCARFFFSEQHS